MILTLALGAGTEFITYYVSGFVSTQSWQIFQLPNGLYVHVYWDFNPKHQSVMFERIVIYDLE